MNPKTKPYIVPALAAVAVIFGAGFIAGGLAQVPGAPSINVGTVAAVAFAMGAFEIAATAIKGFLK